MATIGGPNTEKGNLVFGYDTGYGVADRNTSTRFYPGQPTTNIVPLNLSNSSWFNEYSSGRTLRSETLFGQPAYEFKSNTGQIWISPFAFNSYDRSTNDLTLSVYAKNIGGSAVSMNTYFGGDYSSDSLGNGNTKSIPADNTWRRYSWTRFSSAMSSNYLEFRTANTGVVISCPQLEVGRFVSPIVNGTRSSTESLIDLTRTTDINVSNVSFSSTGQPEFDGTDDTIQISDPNVSSFTGFSIEMIIKPSNASSSPMVITPNSGGIDHFVRFNSNGRLYMRMVVAADSSVQDFTTTTSLSSTDYHYTVFTFKQSEGGKAYYNGSQESAASANFTALDWSSIWKIGQRGNNTFFFDGEIPILKVHNKAISAEEVKQNYNAYKNRFNI